jgi:hypothetical protein
MLPPKVSVLIPTYSYARYLPEAIESVLAQDFRDFELLIRARHVIEKNLSITTAVLLHPASSPATASLNREGEHSEAARARALSRKRCQRASSVWSRMQFRAQASGSSAARRSSP